MSTQNLLTYGLFIIVIALIFSAYIAGSLIGGPIQRAVNLGYMGLNSGGRGARNVHCC